MKYTKITLTMVVRADESESVQKELNESLDIIEMVHTIYTDEMTTEDAPRPDNADEIEMGDVDFYDEDSLVAVG